MTLVIMLWVAVRRSESHWMNAGWLTLILLGALVVLGVVGITTGDPRAPLNVQDDWGLADLASRGCR